MTDLEIRKNVEAELNFEPSANAAEIVAVKDGIVTLTGRVDSYWEKFACHFPASAPTKTSRAAVNRLEWTITVPKDRIKVKVSKGWVTLEGEVDWQFQKNAAEGAMRDLVGIKGVINRITVKERASTAEVKAKIEEALKRSAEVDASHITVETEGDKVILKGTVRSWFEREEAERAA